MVKNVLNGGFVVGCNYWASHAGTAMWSEWRSDVIEKDFQALSEYGIQILRVFPLWPDFQPISWRRKWDAALGEYMHGEIPLADDEAGQAGVSVEAISHFEELTRLSEKYGLKLIVSLITGWMSGRLFVPPALEGRNVLTDARAIMWQTRFVHYFVEHFKGYPVIVAWDLGNECNCMDPVPDRDAAYAWSSAIVNSIRAVDNSRSVISGMHSLSPEGKWTMQDQGELTDLLTTHPYPAFTPYCNHDPINTLRTSLHATAESLYYRGIGNKPCFVEEIGTLSPMLGSEAVAADFLRVNLFSSWAHGMNGLLWWCAHEQVELTRAPYDWCSVERELGLLRVDYSPKPVMNTMSTFKKLLENSGLEPLPERVYEAVCIISEEQDHWAAAYSTVVLAKQAGFDVEFSYSNQALKEAPLYLLPCVGNIKKRRFMKIMEKVSEGAVLYISFNGNYLSLFEEYTGMRVTSRERRTEKAEVTFNLGGEQLTLPFEGEFRLSLEPLKCDVLGTEEDGNPSFTSFSFGKGKVYFFGFPLEIMLTKKPGVFHRKDAKPYWMLYRHIACEAMGNRVVSKNDLMTGVTEHPYEDGSRVIIMINYSPETRNVPFTLAIGWKVTEVINGNAPVTEQNGFHIEIANNNAAVISVSNK